MGCVDPWVVLVKRRRSREGGREEEDGRREEGSGGLKVSRRKGIDVGFFLCFYFLLSYRFVLLSDPSRLGFFNFFNRRCLLSVVCCWSFYPVHVHILLDLFPFFFFVNVIVTYMYYILNVFPIGSVVIFCSFPSIHPWSSYECNFRFILRV